MNNLRIIGGGLAGSEAAWEAAKRGISVEIFEMRPARTTGAHISGNLAELVCSNSLGSLLPDRPSGMLIREMGQLDSLILSTAAKEITLIWLVFKPTSHDKSRNGCLV